MRQASPQVAPVAAATRTVERALDLLSEVCASDAIGLTECARRTGLPASTALRLLRTLVAAGFVRRRPTGDYEAGPRLVQLGALATSRESLVRLAHPALDRIAARTGESAYLGLPGPERSAIYVSVVEGTHAIRHTSWVGRSFPMSGLAVGLALDGEVGQAGYVAMRDRDEPDVTAIAAPVRSPSGVVAAISLLGPTYRIDEQALHTYGAVLAQETLSLAAALGVTTGERTSA